MVGKGQTNAFSLDHVFALLVGGPQRRKSSKRIPTCPDGLDGCQKGCGNFEDFHFVYMQFMDCSISYNILMVTGSAGDFLTGNFYI